MTPQDRADLKEAAEWIYWRGADELPAHTAARLAATLRRLSELAERWTNPPLEAAGLAGHGAMFGWCRKPRTHEGKPIGDLIDIYVEDDGLWHWVTSFDEFWLSDLISVLQSAASPLPAVPVEQEGWPEGAVFTDMEGNFYDANAEPLAQHPNTDHSGPSSGLGAETPEASYAAMCAAYQKWGGHSNSSVAGEAAFQAGATWMRNVLAAIPPAPQVRQQGVNLYELIPPPSHEWLQGTATPPPADWQQGWEACRNRMRSLIDALNRTEGEKEEGNG